MTFNPPNLSELLTHEQTMNTRLTVLQGDLRDILDDNSIAYASDEGIIPLIRKLPVPVPTTVEWNCYEGWLTKDGSQSRNNEAEGYPVVRDQSGTSIPNVPVTVRRKPISGGSWTQYGTYISSNDDVYMYPDSNKDGYIYEVYVTANPSISAQLALPQYWFNYQTDDYDYTFDQVLDTANPLISTNVKSIDTQYLSYGNNYFYVTTKEAGQMLLAIPLKNAPAIAGANNNTNIYIGYDITRGNTPSSDGMFGVGGGMVGNGSRNSIGVFLDSSDADFRSTYDSSFYFGGEDIGFTETGVSKECIVHIPGGSSGAYTWFENADASISDYGPYWYASQLGTTYGPCLVVHHSNATANQRIKVTIKYIRATCP